MPCFPSRLQVTATNIFKASQAEAAEHRAAGGVGPSGHARASGGHSQQGGGGGGGGAGGGSGGGGQRAGGAKPMLKLSITIDDTVAPCVHDPTSFGPQTLVLGQSRWVQVWGGGRQTLGLGQSRWG